MSVDLAIRQPELQERINVHQPYDLRSWAIRFSVSTEKIQQAVLVVGPVVKDVKRYLRK
ncbi:hypothetical protein GETHOR_23620 [Geothrix oryzae]|uniref:DUF3606 domain-containing protein n=1 Tax=Geothrix oryzae TaxID=2927975 RepID=A0ABN6UYY0_9BACT|nr:DUF3606 domain-containing protein [Geothrix oryzae]BDU70261.1 hypothetical protein GETHOR_23620 [Geothrix oryzae]